MKKQTIGMAICAATFFALSGNTALAESNTESATQRPAKAQKKNTGKKHAHAHKCKECGKAEKDCTCENKKHDGHEDEHGDHAHDKAEDKK